MGKRVHEPDLWHLNRRSASGAASLGVFVAFMPVPFQMIIAAIGAMIFRVNLPISVLAVWLSNPVTIAPMFIGAYELGAWLLGVPVLPIHMEISVEWLTGTLEIIWAPLIVGSLVLGTITAMAANFAVRLLWRLHLIRRWKQRKLMRSRNS